MASQILSPDRFGRTVERDSNGVDDVYTITDNTVEPGVSFTISVPSGRNIDDVYSTINSMGSNASSSAPPPEITELELLALQGAEYIRYGSTLYKSIAAKTWAINVQAARGGNPISIQDLLSLLSMTDSLEKALKTGSFTTAKYILGQLIEALPQYAEVGQYAIDSINAYLGD